MGSRQRIAAVDHSFHAKTKSTEFLFDILAECGAVERLYCNRWEGGAGIDIQSLARERYDAIVFIQQMYRRSELQKLGDPKKIVLVPMYDGLADWGEEQWERYRSFPIVAFSKTLHRIAAAAGCESIYTRYFPEGVSAQRHASRDHRSGWTVFFWERQSAISWTVVRQVLQDLPVAKVLYKPCPDPGSHVSPISAEDRRRYNVEDVGWLPSREDYLQLVAESDIFIAPRRYEGIGMSFLEAIAMGRVVAAPDHATMNEYIEHGRNGVLYDLSNPTGAFKGCDIATMMKHAAEDVERFADEWRRGRAAIKNVVSAAVNRHVTAGSSLRGWLGKLGGRGRRR